MLNNHRERKQNINKQVEQDLLDRKLFNHMKALNEKIDLDYQIDQLKRISSDPEAEAKVQIGLALKKAILRV